MRLLDEAKEALRYRDLFNNLVERELQVRYKNSVLGVIWSLANPIARALTLVIVFKYILQLGPPNYAAYVMATYFPWTYFLTGILDAGESVSKQMPLVKKVYFPRELLPLATTMANLRHFLLSLGVLGLYLLKLYISSALDGNPETPALPPVTFFLLPVLVVMQTLLIGGIALYISALNVFFEDVKFLMAVVLDLLFYAVPVIYFIEQIDSTGGIPDSIRPFAHFLFLVNPFSVIIASYRACLLGPTVLPAGGKFGQTVAVNVNLGVPAWSFILCMVICVMVFVGGYRFFNSRKWRFVEQL